MPVGLFDSARSLGSRSSSLTGPGQGSQPKAQDPWSTEAQLTNPQYLPTFYTGPSKPSQIAATPTPSPPPSTTFAARMFAARPASTNPLGGIQSIMDTFYGPQNLLLQDQLTRQQDQIGFVEMDADYRRDALNRDTDLARRGLANDRNLTQGQMANLGRLREILKKQYGLNDRTLENALGKFGLDEAQMRDQAERQTWDLRSDLTQRGAFNTVANERGTGRIQKDLLYGIQGLNFARDAARLSHEGNSYGLDEKGIGYDNQTLSLQNTLTGLGLQGERITNSLTDGLRQIGLDSMFSLGGLLDGINSTNQQQAALATTILQEIIGLSGLPAADINAILKALGITAPARAGTGTVLAPSKPAQRPTGGTT